MSNLLEVQIMVRIHSQEVHNGSSIAVRSPLNVLDLDDARMRLSATRPRIFVVVRMSG